MLPRSLHTSLVLTQIVAFATLIRSVAFDRWITVVASLLLLAGAAAAHRGRSWGIALTFATAMAFPAAWAIGIAPAWFVLVGLIAALPFGLTWRAFARSDRAATGLLAGLAASGGALAALGWKAFAWDVFGAFPSLYPSAVPHHGLAVAALLGVGGVFAAKGLLKKDASDHRVRVAEPAEQTRIAVTSSASSARDAESELHDEWAARARDKRHA